LIFNTPFRFGANACLAGRQVENQKTKNNDIMKSFKKELWFNTEKRYQFVHITPQVQEAVRESGIREGLCLVNAMHITASVFINDNESGLHQDYMEWLEKLAPYSRDGYHHNIGEDNGDAHLKRQVMGREVVIAITNGALDLGPWEAVFYGEFDGKRKKRVLIKIIGE
jgi:secondary thiamine-phosphate synthase enzyme